MSAGQVWAVVNRYSERGVRNSLARLVQQGILTRTPAGARAGLFELNRNHIAAEFITRLADLRRILLDRIIDALDTWPFPPVYAALFGSAARGDMTPDSDIDLFLVRSDTVDPEDGTWEGQVSALAHDVSVWTGNDTRPFELSVSEVRHGAAGGEQVLRDIAEEGITLHGHHQYLRRLLVEAKRGA
jgi:predicted nucleotidyltransferase